MGPGTVPVAGLDRGVYVHLERDKIIWKGVLEGPLIRELPCALHWELLILLTRLNLFKVDQVGDPPYIHTARLSFI